MATENQEVKDIERVEVVPTQDNELVDEEIETQPESSPEKTDEDESDESKETTEESVETEEEPEPGVTADEPDTEVKKEVAKPIAGETPREYALRLEATRLKGLLRGERKQELFTIAKAPAGQENVVQDEFVKKFKPEEVENFTKLAKSLGFVQKNEVASSSYDERASDELDKFLETHPEYLPEQDHGNVLWNRLKEEFSIFAKPTNPKDYRRILERAHQAVFNIKPISKLKTNDAAKEKIKVASHSGASRTTNGQSLVQRKSANTDLRTDMLKGFSEDEIAEIEQG